MATVCSSLILQSSGGLIDKIRLRYCSLINGLLLAAFCLFIAWSSNRIMLGIGLMGLRLTGQGLMVLIGSTAIARYFEQERGKSLSLASMGLSVGEAVLPVTVTFLLSMVSWQMGMQVLALSVMVVFIPLSVFLIKKGDAFQLPRKIAGDDDQYFQYDLGRKEMLHDPFFYLVIPSGLFPPLLFTGVLVHQNILVNTNSWTMQWMATSFIAFGVSRVISNFVTGPLIDRFSGRKIFAFHIIPALLSVIGFLLSDSKWMVPLFFALMGITMSFGSVGKGAMLAETYGISKLGAIKSFVTMLMILATAVAPVVMGVYLERLGTFTDIFALSAVLSAALLIMALIGVYLFPVKRKT